MAVKQIYWLVPALGITYAAGWFSHWPPAVETVRNQKLTMVTATPPGGGMTAGAASAAGPAYPDQPREILPLTSLAEILELLGGLKDGPDELAMIDAADLLPRLMVTDGATIRRLLGEAVSSPELAGDSELHSLVAGGLLFRGMMLHPEETAAFVLSNTDKLKGMEDATPFIVAWAAKSNAGAAERLLAMMPEESRDETGELLQKLKMNADPAAALRAPSAFENLDSSEIHKLAIRWMRSDAPALLAWRAALPEGDGRNAVDSAIVDSVLRQNLDPAAAESRLGVLPAELAAQGRLRLLSQDISAAIAKKEGDPDSAALNPAEYAPRLTQLLAQASGSQGPASSEAQAAAQSLSNAYRQEGKFAEGAAWSATLPEGEMRERAVGGLIGPWVDKDSAAASAWIDSLPAGSLRDMAAGKLIERIQTDDPVNALVWARALSDESKRRDSVSEIYRSWFAFDPIAASQAVQSLPAADQQLLHVKKAEDEQPQRTVVVEERTAVRETGGAPPASDTKKEQHPIPAQPVPVEENGSVEEPDPSPPAEEPKEE
ncbi:MAG: hypothetical protein JWM59_5037 [Verrucomicrobiales bacterium]|nr:hypothetical protein [Verrucomicrobiales bacterium]